MKLGKIINKVFKLIKQNKKPVYKQWKPGIIYSGEVKGFNLSPNIYKRSYNTQSQSAKEVFENTKELNSLIQNPEIVRDVVYGKPTFVLKNKNLLKEYLESSQYRKKLRKAGIPENQIQERINGLNDVDIRIDKANTLDQNINGLSQSSLKQIIFSPKKYASRNELIQHELAHIVDKDHYFNRSNVLRIFGKEAPYKDNYKHMTIYNSKGKLTSFRNNQDQRMQYNYKVLDDVLNKYLDKSKPLENYDKNYFLTLSEMVAKIQPLQINAWKNNWSPSQQVRFLQFTPNIQRMKSLIGEKGIQELTERLLKKGGKL